jgi:hypothetical protein
MVILLICGYTGVTRSTWVFVASFVEPHQTKFTVKYIWENFAQAKGKMEHLRTW